MTASCHHGNTCGSCGLAHVEGSTGKTQSQTARGHGKRVNNSACAANWKLKSSTNMYDGEKKETEYASNMEYSLQLLHKGSKLIF